MSPPSPLSPPVILSAIVICAIISIVSSASSRTSVRSDAHTGGKNTLVLVDDLSLKESHSIFFNDLKKRGHILTFLKGDDPNLVIKQYGEYLYHNIILFTSSIDEYGGNVDVSALLDFVDNGGNILVGSGSNIGDPVREFASECGLDYDEDMTSVIDHYYFDDSDFDGDHTLIIAGNYAEVAPSSILGDRPRDLAPVLFDGLGGALNDDNRLIFPIISGYTTTYSANPDIVIKDKINISGRNTVLVAGLQARNNARVVFSGSVSLFSDDFFTSTLQFNELSNDVASMLSSPSLNHQQFTQRFNAKVSGNREFAQAMSQWVFREIGVLRATDIQITKFTSSGEDKEGAYTRPKEFMIGETVQYRVTIEQYIAQTQKWVPYIANDIQLEYIMLNPYLRMFLNNTSPSSGRYSSVFVLPDVYGIFKFQINYNKLGYSNLFVMDTIKIRPLRHNEFPRFILNAYPYYLSVFCCMAAVFVFSFIFLFHKSFSIGDGSAMS